MSAQLYDDLIMEHIKNARNFGVLEGADRCGSGTNPLCGDEVLVYLKMNGSLIAELAFQCTCCGISMASASIVTDMLKSRTADEALGLIREFLSTLSRAPSERDLLGRSPEQLALLDTVERFPSRVQCAALAWTAIESALESRDAASVTV